MSIADVGAGLRAALDSIVEARALAASALEAATRARRATTAVIAGSGHPLVMRAVACYTAAIQRFMEADAAAVAAATAVGEYGRIIGVSLPPPAGGLSTTSRPTRVLEKESQHDVSRDLGQAAAPLGLQCR